MFAAHFTPGIFNPKLQPWTIHKVAKSHFTNFQFKKSCPNEWVAWMGHNFYHNLNLTLMHTTVFKYFKNKQDQSISAPAQSVIFKDT